MSTIPAGLRADHMRTRMEDKAVVQHAGGLLVGGTTSVTYYISENPSTTDHFYDTVELEPGAAGTVLTSKGSGQIPEYKLISADSIADGAITANKLGNGTVLAADTMHKYALSVAPSTDVNILRINFYQVN